MVLIVDIYCIKIVDIISVMNIVLIKGVLFPGCFNEKTGKTLESKNAPPNGYILSIKGRTCNPTPLVHQDMTKKTTFYEK